jgi:hypothetical protein
MQRGLIARRGNCLDGAVVFVEKLVIIHELVKRI